VFLVVVLKMASKVDEYLANAGFGLASLDTIPFESLALGLSTLSGKGLLDLHGKSKDIKNRRLRAVAEEAMKYKLRNMIGIEQLAVIEHLVGPVNYRYLFIAARAVESNNNRTIVVLSSSSYAAEVTIEVTSFTVSVASYDEHTRTMFTELTKYGITHDTKIDSTASRVRPTLFFWSLTPTRTLVDFKLVPMFIVYFYLKLYTDMYVSNEYWKFPDFPPGAKIRCSICDSSAKLVCSDCNEYFCEKH